MPLFFKIKAFKQAIFKAKFIRYSCEQYFYLQFWYIFINNFLAKDIQILTY